MAVQHVKVLPNDGFLAIARRLSPVGVTQTQVGDFAVKIAAANGKNLNGSIVVGEWLHYDDADVPVVVLPPPVVTPPVGVIAEKFDTAAAAQNFVALRGQVSVVSGRLHASSANTEIDAYHKTDLGSTDHEVSADFIAASTATSGSWFAINARMATTGLVYYSVETSSDRSKLVLHRVNGASYTQLGEWTTGWANGQTHNVKLRCVGNVIEVLVDGTSRIRAVDAAPITVGTRVGVHAFVSATQAWGWDNFSAAKMPEGTIPTPPPPTPPATGQFYIKDGLIGRDGKRFVPVGVNGVATARTAAANPGQWWNDTGMGVMNGKSKLFTDLGFNFVRINDMRDYGQFGFQDFQNGLFDTMDEYLARGVTVMPTYHRQGPGTNPTPAQMASNADFQAYWSSIVARYKGNPNVWLNPLNEPIGSAWDMWETLATYQYDLLRGLGWTGLIVIDLPQWAQGIGFAPDRAAPWATNGGRTGVVLGFHNYDMGDATAAVRACQAKGVPVLVGEGGATLGQVATPSFDWCVSAADSLGTGCVFWWGAGNRNDDYVLRTTRGSTFYDVNVPLSEAGKKMFALAANRPAPAAL